MCVYKLENFNILTSDWFSDVVLLRAREEILWGADMHIIMQQ